MSIKLSKLGIGLIVVGLVPSLWFTFILAIAIGPLLIGTGIGLILYNDLRLRIEGVSK